VALMTDIEVDLDKPADEQQPAERAILDRPRLVVAMVAVAGLLVISFVAAMLPTWRATPAPAAPAATVTGATEYRLAVEVTEGAQAIRAVYYRDGRAEMLPDRAATMPDVAVVVVTVVSAKDGEAGCRITVNNIVIDDAQASGGGQALCVWVAGNGPVVAVEAGVLRAGA
jgi:hypothetical protein